ncbi:zinc ribbon domain-containing protein [Actinophytocola xanthii]|uniref:Zinc ribbon domain-containing protein n=1 Tax=Actinophytocola xanthii TaxID=1912961 RepID=A0A1Q8CTD0_9PSEU|nr:zinc ribbon domain-containing protein [Actinophytocola xanthii]OLF17612.1 zinc ribbon domain-containing protein [Actinophytocola xanthii]
MSVSTRTCPQCGAAVGAADDFCGNCGNYLGWAAGPPRSAGTGGGAVGPPAAEDSAAAPPSSATAAEVSAASSDGPPDGTAAARSVVERFEQFGPVLPGRPEARRPLPTAAEEATVAGPPCPACGTTNPPGRRFCRRCATPLHPEQRGAHAGRRRGWRWRGDRSRWLRRLAALLVATALVVAAILFFPQAVILWDDLRDRLATPTPVVPVSTEASATVAGHPATNAADGLSNRYWGAPDVGASVDFGFAEPFRLLSVVVHTGASAEEEGFAAQARPAAVDMVITRDDGTTRTLAVTLADEPGPQTTETGVSGVVRIRLVVREARGTAPGRHIALGEVEFFRR